MCVCACHVCGCGMPHARAGKQARRPCVRVAVGSSVRARASPALGEQVTECTAWECCANGASYTELRGPYDRQGVRRQAHRRLGASRLSGCHPAASVAQLCWVHWLQYRHDGCVTSSALQFAALQFGGGEVHAACDAAAQRAGAGAACRNFTAQRGRQRCGCAPCAGMHAKAGEASDPRPRNRALGLPAHTEKPLGKPEHCGCRRRGGRWRAAVVCCRCERAGSGYARI